MIIVIEARYNFYVLLQLISLLDKGVISRTFIMRRNKNVGKFRKAQYNDVDRRTIKIVQYTQILRLIAV